MDDSVEQKPAIEETEDKPQGIVIRDYAPEDEGKISDLYYDLYSTPQGQQSLVSRYGSVISLEEFKTSLFNPTTKHTSVVISPEGDEIIGLGQYIVSDHTPNEAEIALLISQRYQGRGIGLDLVKKIIGRCKDLNPEIKLMKGVAFAANQPSIKMLTRAREILGGSLEIIPDENNPDEIEYHFSFPLDK